VAVQDELLARFVAAVAALVVPPVRFVAAVAALVVPPVRSAAAVAAPDAPPVRFVVAVAPVASPVRFVVAAGPDVHSVLVAAQPDVRSGLAARRAGCSAQAESGEPLPAAGFAAADFVAGSAPDDNLVAPTADDRFVPAVALLDDYPVDFVEPVHSGPDVRLTRADFRADYLFD
jgi:hypothetical protein